MRHLFKIKDWFVLLFIGFGKKKNVVKVIKMQLVEYKFCPRPLLTQNTKRNNTVISLAEKIALDLVFLFQGSTISQTPLRIYRNLYQHGNDE